MCDEVAPTAVAAPVLAALADDLNTAGAITELHRLAAAGDAGTLKAAAQMMGLLDDTMGHWYQKADLVKHIEDASLGIILTAWKEYRQAKDFAKADFIRDSAAELGLVLQVSKEEGEGISHPQAPSEEWRKAVRKFAETLK